MATYTEGSAGFLFLQDDSNYIMRQTTGEFQFSPEIIQEIYEAHSERLHRLRKLGVSYQHIVIPNKETVYNDFLPNNIRYEEFGATPLRQFHERTARHPRIAWFRPDILQKLRQDGRSPYMKRDTHWTDDGAYNYFSAALEDYGFEAELSILRNSEMHICEEVVQGDLAKLADGEPEVVRSLRLKNPNFNLEFEGDCVNEGYVRLQKCGKSNGKRRALVHHDSFTHWLFPFIGQVYDEVLFIHGPDIDFGLVEHFKADHVWFIQVERFFIRVPRNWVSIVEFVERQEAIKGVSHRSSKFLRTLCSTEGA